LFFWKLFLRHVTHSTALSVTIYFLFFVLPQFIERIQLEYTKALAISKIKDDEKRSQVLKQAIESKLSLSKIKELVEEVLADSPILEKPSKNKSPLLKAKEFSTRIIKVTKIGKASGIWNNPQQVKQLAKYLSQIEKLFAEAEPLNDDENNSEDASDNAEE
jgi:ParB family transcriptional regulator, chromosome partitioning protein